MSAPRDQQYLGWGGKSKHVTVDLDLGMGTHRGIAPYGLRRMIWAAAMGYVSGFDKRDIVYFCLTRCISKRINHWVLRREGFEFRDGLPVARVTMGGQSAPESLAISPDCRDGKHRACRGDAFDVTADRECPCACTCHPDTASAETPKRTPETAA